MGLRLRGENLTLSSEKMAAQPAPVPKNTSCFPASTECFSSATRRKSVRPGQRGLGPIAGTPLESRNPAWQLGCQRCGRGEAKDHHPARVHCSRRVVAADRELRVWRWGRPLSSECGRPRAAAFTSRGIDRGRIDDPRSDPESAASRSHQSRHLFAPANRPVRVGPLPGSDR